MLLFRSLTLGAFALFIATTAFAQSPLFSVRFNFDAIIQDFEVADINGDGVDDLVFFTAVLGGAPSNELVLQINQGICELPVITTIAAPNTWSRFFIADLNADGFDDIVMARTLTGDVEILLNDAQATPSFSSVVHPFPSSAALARGRVAVDVDADGDLDLAAGSSVSLNDGNGVFGPVFTVTELGGPAVIGPPFSTPVAMTRWIDIDGDGKAEYLRVVPKTDGSIDAAFGEFDSGTGDLVGTNVLTALGPMNNITSISLQSGDFDGDGTDDLLLERRNSAPSAQRFLFFGNAMTPLQTSELVPSSLRIDRLFDVTGRDLNGDGLGELVGIVEDDPDSIQTFARISSVFQATPISYPTPAFEVRVGDFDGDGLGDLVRTEASFFATGVALSFGGGTGLWTLTQVSGPAGGSYSDNTQSAPLEFELRDCDGNPSPGRTVFLTGLPLGFGASPAISAVTDASGRVSFQINFGTSSSAEFELEVNAPLAAQTVLSFSRVTAIALDLIEGPDEFLMAETEAPVRVLATDPVSGMPLAGESLVISADFGVSFVGSTTQVTDTAGIAEFRLRNDIPGFLREYRIESLSDPFVNVSETFFPRGLTVFPFVTSANAIVRYFHESNGVPFLIVGDTPLPAPGFIATPFGNIGTSILSPGPDLVTLRDQTGPQLLVPIPPSLVGVTLAVQTYGIDEAYSFPESIFISNTVIVTF